jgi:hypothetical protein
LFPPLLCNLFLAELPRLALQHLNLLVKRELHLVTHGYQALRNVLVVLPQQVDCEEEVIDVVEHDCMFIGVLLLLGKEGDRVLAPMAKWVEVVRGVVAVVVAVAVALLNSQLDAHTDGEGELTGTSMSVILDLKSESGSTSSTKACWPQLPVIRARRMKARGIRNTKVVARAFT